MKYNTTVANNPFAFHTTELPCQNIESNVTGNCINKRDWKITLHTCTATLTYKTNAIVRHQQIQKVDQNNNEVITQHRISVLLDCYSKCWIQYTGLERTQL